MSQVWQEMSPQMLEASPYRSSLNLIRASLSAISRKKSTEEIENHWYMTDCQNLGPKRVTLFDFNKHDDDN